MGHQQLHSETLLSSDLGDRYELRIPVLNVPC